MKPSTDSPGETDSRRAAREILGGRGLRRTEARVRILEIFTNSDGHLTVADIHAAIEPDLPGVELSSVYRTITTFQELGLIHRVDVSDQPATYGLAHVPHHHAVCTSCGAVTEVPAEALAAAVNVAEHATGYALSASASLQLHGLCADCQRSQASALT